MADFLNDNVHKGKNTHEGELIADGTLTVGPPGLNYGETIETPGNSWPGHVRVQVADIPDRDALVAWRAANSPITPTNPLLVWRADGSLTGVNELTVDGVNWYAETPLAGDIEMTMAAAAPYGWLLLQGQLLANAATNYPALWAAASPLFRSGSDLRLPDLRGRSPMGAGTGTGLTLRNLGDAVGAESVALTTAQLPAHHHSGTTGGSDRSLNHRHYSPFGGTEDSASLAGTGRSLWYSGSGATLLSSTIYDTVAANTDVNLNHLHPFTTQDTGNGQAHPNVHPSAILNFKVKV